MEYANTTARLGITPADNWDLIFRDEAGLPIKPRNFYNLFCRLAHRAGLRPNRLHGFRHAAATILKNLGVPEKDIQAILGHSRISTTRDVYEHADMDIQQKALSQLERLVLQADDSDFSRQHQPSNQGFGDNPRLVQSVKSAGWEADGHPGGKSHILSKLISNPALSPVMQQLRTSTERYIFGVAAVTLAVKIDGSEYDSIHALANWISLHEELTPTPMSFVDRLSSMPAALNVGP